ncbi:DUF3857 domain-containing protein [Lutibacter maritimus]|uniref:Transglutaminase-like enzyme, putative cysteine protease n=1 Tax=Lutibacter maritimus TaxID=593133 RepID=A0A1I6Q227_9FLAO|nr:DUF3857 domain-containing protein [Lutibacter maritimus]SFS46462.1 Transglutaminase-like enzyme, putative cysteine protease [Lutibacter maritimus]
MKKTKIVVLFTLYFIQISYSQDYNFNSATIPQNIKEDAHSVVLFDQVSVELKSQKSMSYIVKKAVTVLNKFGNGNRYVVVPYDGSRRIKSVSTIIYNAFGNQIKKVKNKEYKDVSQVDGGTLFADNRLLYFEYIPLSYPYTIYYEYEIETSNTAFIPSWNPLSDFETGLLTSSYQINYNKELKLNIREINFENYKVEKSENENSLNYKISNLEPINKEPLSLSLKELLPNVKIASNQFYVEGEAGEASNWKELGKWEYDNLYRDVGYLSDETVAKINLLVKDADSDLEKAKIIYQYVQDKTRYISVQVGIGGLKPMLASEVDRLGYGDCKALTNYTKSLLNAVGVKSYFTELFGGFERLDMDFNSPSIQGNHVILNLPLEEGDVWLECTSQKVPFGYIANFTDDRNVIVIKPEGGELKKTTVYPAQNNIQLTKGNFAIDNDGTINAKLKIESSGTQYNDNLDSYEGKNPTELDAQFKAYFNSINNIVFSKIEVLNNKNDVKYEENIEFSASNYASISGNKMLINVNAFNKNTVVPKRIRNRKLPFEISRGFVDIDEVEIKLPKTYEIEYVPTKKEITSKFGTYTFELIKINDYNYLYKRKLQIETGKYKPEEYEDYRNFKKDININDNIKIILKTI